MHTFVGAVGGAILLMVVGRIWKGRDFMGLAFGTMIIGLIIGASCGVVISMGRSEYINNLIAKGWPLSDFETVIKIISASTPEVIKTVRTGIPAAVTFGLGILFVAFARPNHRG